jgi:aspartate dehydrogenase
VSGQPLRVGLLGLGAIGRQVADGILAGRAGDVELCAVLTRRPRDQSEVAAPLMLELAPFLSTAPQVVLEAASAEAVATYAEPILASGADLVVVSAAGLVDAELRMRLDAVCQHSGARLYVATGALAGVDALAAAAVGGLDEVTLRVVEPGVERWDVYVGSALAGASQFPDRLNVAATAALAAQADMPVTLVEEPGEGRREIELTARGVFGEFRARMQPRPRTDQLSHIVALSLLATLRRLHQPLRIG